MPFKKNHFIIGLFSIFFIFLNTHQIIAQSPVVNNGKVEKAVTDPQMHIDMARLDFGIIPLGQKLSKRVEITNTGKGVLKWRGTIEKDGGNINSQNRYIGLANDEIKSSGVYKIPLVYRDSIELSGQWLESDGQPVLNTRSVLKYHFSGTGLRIYYWKEPDVGKYSIYINQNFIIEVDIQADKKERADVLVAENLPMGQHVLTIVGKEGKAILEGFEVYGKPVMKGPAGWIVLLPNSGVTTREIDYVTIIMNTQKMTPGIFGEVVAFSSNGGIIDIPISVEIANDYMQKAVDVFRYASGNDYLFTANPQVDEPLILNRKYAKEGIAFRLFSSGVPGTVEFYRWYNPTKGSHFYSHNRNDAAKIEREYVFEGPIGNIATTRLRNTRELYRWFNPKSGFYFYSMDIRGDGIQKKGYQYDGISGYVK
jgi:hypothetical protein